MLEERRQQQQRRRRRQRPRLFNVILATAAVVVSCASLVVAAATTGGGVVVATTTTATTSPEQQFPTPRTIEEAKVILSTLPPGPILFITNLFDTVTNRQWRNLPLGQPFRRLVDPHGDGYLRHVIPSLIEHCYQNQLRPFPLAMTDEDEDNSSYSLSSLSLSSITEYLFHTNDTILADLTHPITVTCVLPFVVLLIYLLKSILVPKFRSVGRYMGRQTHGPQWEYSNEERITKFGEYVFRLLYHTTVSVWGLYYIFGHRRDNGSDDAAAAASSPMTWWNNTEELYKGHPFHPLNSCGTWYYLVQCAYNVEALFELARLSFVLRHPFSVDEKKKKNKTCWQFPIGWSPTIRGDFREMSIHHVVTNLLVFLSSSTRLTRTGSMVFLVHDISDVPVDLSKLANFLKWKTTTTICFVTMLLTWFVTRLYVLPLIIWKSVWLYPYLMMIPDTSSEHIYDPVHPIIFRTYYWFFWGLLGMLIVLHMVWFAMIVNIGYWLLKKGEAHDLSEHKKGESYHQYNQKKDDNNTTEDDDTNNNNTESLTPTLTTSSSGGSDDDDEYVVGEDDDDVTNTSNENEVGATTTTTTATTRKAVVVTTTTAAPTATTTTTTTQLKDDETTKTTTVVVGMVSRVENNDSPRAISEFEHTTTSTSSSDHGGGGGVGGGKCFHKDA